MKILKTFKNICKYKFRFSKLKIERKDREKWLSYLNIKFGLKKENSLIYENIQRFIRWITLIYKIIFLLLTNDISSLTLGIEYTNKEKWRNIITMGLIFILYELGTNQISVVDGIKDVIDLFLVVGIFSALEGDEKEEILETVQINEEINIIEDIEKLNTVGETEKKFETDKVK